MKRGVVFLLFCLITVFPPSWAEAICTNTSNVGVCKLALGDTGWNVQTNANWDIMDGLFDELTGHKHTGVAGQGPLLGPKYVSCDGATNLNTCVSGITTPTVVYINAPITYSGATTLSNLLTLSFGGTGEITCPASTLTVNSGIEERTGAEIFDSATCATRLNFATNTRVTAYDLSWFGAKPNDSISDSAAIATVLSGLQSVSAGTTVLRFSRKGTYDLTQQILITERMLVFEGQGGGNNAPVRLSYSGTAASLFELGTDDGEPYDSANYDGVQGLVLRDLNIYCATTGKTALTNGLGSYCAGKRALRDWRGGHVRIERVVFEEWEYGFWGIQSDINRFTDVGCKRCKYGLYFGPRSDQAIISGYYPLFSDTALILDRTEHIRVQDSHFVECGSSTSPAAIVKSDWTRGSIGNRFERVWWEYFGTSNQNTAAFVTIGGTGGEVKDTYFIDNHILVSTVEERPSYFIQSQNATRLFIKDTSFYAHTTSMGGLVKLINYTGSTATPQAHVNIHFDYYQPATAGAIFNNASTGSPNVQVQITGASSHMFMSGNGRIYSHLSTPDPLKDFYFGSLGLNGNLQFVWPNDGTGNTTRFKLNRRFVYVGGNPTLYSPWDGYAWNQGDIAINEAPTAGGPVMWVCVTSGTPGTWKVIATAAS